MLSIHGDSIEPASHPSGGRYRPDILEQLEAFAKTFRRRRIEYGFSQQDFGKTLKQLYGVTVSQSTVSRFEALNLTIRNMRRLRVVLERWLDDVGRATREEGRPPADAELAAMSDGEERTVEISGTGRQNPLTVRVREDLDYRIEAQKLRQKRTTISGEAQAVLKATFEKVRVGKGLQGVILRNVGVQCRSTEHTNDLMLICKSVTRVEENKKRALHAKSLKMTVADTKVMTVDGQMKRHTTKFDACILCR